MKILIVEDEKDLCLSIAKGLKIDGYAVDTCYNGNDALEMMLIENYDLVVLDLNLPNIDGLDILKEVRQQNKTLKIIILTARTHISDKVTGLDLGANDYLTKPFHFEELEARIRCLLRQNVIMNNRVLTCGKLSFDTLSRKCYANGEEIDLTKREAGLLEYLMINKGRIISQEELLEHVWDSSVDSFSNAVRVHISSLRKKIKTMLNYNPIQNKINEGYLITERCETNA